MLVAASETLEIGTILRDILVVLVAAKLAAEVAERLGIPAVLGEILAGIAIGPSLLGLVEQSDVLFMLGEIGVILLLLQVGMEMDLGELGKVGRASLLVAVIGVAAPFATGAAGGLALGQDATTAIFLGAALTATSVGITARVFGDLRALASTEARIVLGAAVADDVLGLIILTVVARVIVDGSISAGTIVSTILLAVGFLLLTGVIGIAFAPAIFNGVQRISRSAATLTAVAFAFTLAFATLADIANLAPIIGAFMAGLAMGRTEQAHRIERELTPVGHLFIPVFFLQIGIDTDIGAVFEPKVLGIAAVLTVIAVAGKLVSAVGAAGTRADRWTIGLGMIPRGEVGLIFATIGLRNGVLDDDLYAALVLVVLATTVITPPLLRIRAGQLAGRTTLPPVAAGGGRPPGGWVGIDDSRIILRGTPPIESGLAIAFRAGRLAVHAKPGTSFLDWFGETRDAPLAWNDEATAEFLRLLRHGNARSWRLLDRLAVLDRAFPELAAALAIKRDDPSEVDLMHALRWELVDRLHDLADDDSLDPRFAREHARLEHPDRLELAALTLDITDDGQRAKPIVRTILRRLELRPGAEIDIAALVLEHELLRAAARDPDSFDQQVVLELATHLETPERTRALYLLTIALGDLPSWQRKSLDELYDLVMDGLAHPELSGRDAETLADARRRQAAALADDPAVRDRIDHASRSYLLANEPIELARQAALIEPVPRPGIVRVAVSPNGSAGLWKVHVVTRDRPGLLARVTAALARSGLDIASASIATWGDGAVLDTFTVGSAAPPDPDELARLLERAIRTHVPAQSVADVNISFDNRAMPWHTACLVSAPDRPALLSILAAAFAEVGAVVHSARASTDDGIAADRFALTDRLGRKLDDATMGKVTAVLEGSPVKRRRVFARR